MKILLILSLVVFSVNCSSKYCVYTNNKKKFIKVFKDPVDSYCPTETVIYGDKFFLVSEDK